MVKFLLALIQLVLTNCRGAIANVYRFIKKMGLKPRPSRATFQRFSVASFQLNMLQYFCGKK